MAKNTKQPPVEVIELNYQLAELPSSQHRAGLAGLVLMVKWLERLQVNKGICQLTRLDSQGATLKLDLDGLKALFDELYAAYIKEKPPKNEKTSKKKAQAKIPESQINNNENNVEGEEEDDDDGKNVVIAKAGLLLDFDPTSNQQEGLWIKLWRDMLWQVLRSRDRSRIPFKLRAENKQTKDVLETWDALTNLPSYTSKLSSSYFIGAQTDNDENVPFKDRARYLFLLHFWPYVAQIYVPTTVDNEGKSQFNGYALAIPDIAELDFFCQEFPDFMKSRNGDLLAYYPKAAVVDLAVESALDLFSKLIERLKTLTGNQSLSSLLLGVDVIHLKKVRNNVKLLGSTRLDPEMTMIDEYNRLRTSLSNIIFRRQRLLNLVNQKDWYIGFDRVFSTLPKEQTFESGFFCKDARHTFEEHNKEITMQTTDNIDDVTTDEVTKSCEQLVYQVVRNYVYRKLKSKYQLEWPSVKGNPAREQEYREKREKIAKEAFFAVRSRSGIDFIDYFASTLCSTPQHLTEDQFSTITKALYEETDKVRTLTMLALSALS
jgi:CRISPR-associated protein Cmx8